MSTRRAFKARLIGASSAGAVALASVVLMPSVAEAAVTKVSTERQLRKAIVQANKNPGRDKIKITKSITFDSSADKRGGAKFGDLDIKDDLVIDGQGFAIDADGLDRILDIGGQARVVVNYLELSNGAPSAGASGGAVRIKSNAELDLSDSFVNGSEVVGDGASGGAIFNSEGTLTLRNVELIDNRAVRAGGAIEALAGSTSIMNSTFFQNTAGVGPGNGGAFHLTGAGSVIIQGSQFSDNAAAAEGGAVWNSDSGIMRIDTSSFSQNIASGAASDQGGGAVYSDGGNTLISLSRFANNQAIGAAGSGGAVLSKGALNITASNFTENTTPRAGGAVELAGGSLAVERSEFTNNIASGAPGNGGAIHITGALDSSINESKFTGNVATSEGGAVWNNTGAMTVSNSTVRVNTAQGDADDNGGGGLFNEGGDLTVIESSVDSNSATGASGSGGGIFTNAGELTVRRSSILRNEANRAGGGIESKAGDVLLGKVEINNNAAVGGGNGPGNGGAFHLSGEAEVLVNKSDAIGNTAANEGGGLWNSAAGSMSVIASSIINNVASGAADDSGGGGIYNDGDLLISSSQINNNQADGAAGSGGGVLNVGSAIVQIENSAIDDNSATRAGGGVESNGNGGTVSLNDVDFDNNSAGPNPGNGGAIHVTGAVTVSYVIGVVTNNSATNEGGGLWNSATGTFNADGITFDGNTAGVEGPNFYNDGGDMNVNGNPVPANTGGR